MRELPKYDLSALNCSVCQVFERRNLLTGALDNYEHPIEVVLSFPESMGERAVMSSLYYDEFPTNEELYADARKEMRDWIKPENFLTAGIYTPTAYDEIRIKEVKKALRTAPKSL